jgi:hypothetical protein
MVFLLLSTCFFMISGLPPQEDILSEQTVR